MVERLSRDLTEAALILTLAAGSGGEPNCRSTVANPKWSSRFSATAGLVDVSRIRHSAVTPNAVQNLPRWSAASA